MSLWPLSQVLSIILMKFYGNLPHLIQNKKIKQAMALSMCNLQFCFNFGAHYVEILAFKIKILNNKYQVCDENIFSQHHTSVV